MVFRPTWQKFSGTPGITKREVHVWRVKHHDYTDDIECLRDALDERERKKAERFVRASDQIRYIVSHGILRLILSLYSDADPKDIEYTYNYYGKPFLKEEYNEGPLCFNVTDSLTTSLVAVGYGVEVGIDIEGYRKLEDKVLLAKSVFTEKEMLLFEGLDGQAYEDVFFYCWTRKEAVIKAIGKGLTIPLKGFSTIPNFQTENIEDNNEIFLEIEKIQWKINSFEPRKGYYAAMATNAVENNIKYYELARTH